jgi:hypothetical protein
MILMSRFNNASPRRSLGVTGAIDVGGVTLGFMPFAFHKRDKTKAAPSYDYWLFSDQITTNSAA